MNNINAGTLTHSTAAAVSNSNHPSTVLRSPHALRVDTGADASSSSSDSKSRQQHDTMHQQQHQQQLPPPPSTMQMVDVSSMTKSSIAAHPVASPQTASANQSKSFTFQGASPQFSHGTHPFEKSGGFGAQKSGGPSSSSSPASQKYAHASAPLSDDVLKRRAAAAVEFGFIEAAVASGLPTGPPQLRPFELTRALLRWFWDGWVRFFK
jgi:hypothetical protein